MCSCNFTIPNKEYDIGSHTITFQSILNGEIRGSTTIDFSVIDRKSVYVIMVSLIKLLFLLLTFGKKYLCTFALYMMSVQIANYRPD